MASPEIQKQLADIESSSTSQGDKGSAFTSLLNSIIASSAPEQLTANLTVFIDTILSDNVGIVTSRPVLAEYVNAISKLPSAEIKKEVYEYTLEKIRPKIVSFEEQDCNIREALATIYEAEEEHGEAAKVLQGIQLNPHQRQITDEFRLQIYIRIMRNLLEDDESISADVWLNRATLLIHKSEDPQLNLMFQMCQARILDAKRQFLNACSKYHQLSFSPIVAESDRMQCLSAAMTCAILAPAGPLRSRSLATLYKDERSPQLPQDYALLEKMYMDRLLSQKEVDEFASRLKPHQVATQSDGTTVLSKAVIEHNLLAASRLYNNIGVEELGVLLGLSGEKAEEYAARMIEQKRMSGQIDQIDGLIYFDSISGAAKEGGAAVGSAEKPVGRQIRRWDENVSALAQEVENITSMLQNEYPVSNSSSVAPLLWFLRDSH
jgi:COP9 signalosome complex subunit 4